MTVPDLLAACRAASVELFLDGNRLRYRAPAGALTTELREGLQARKQELTALLAAPPGPDSGSAAAFVAECERIIAAGLTDLTPPQQNVAEVYLGLARQYAGRRDELLWTMPDFLRGELARWQRRRSSGFSAPAMATTTT